LSVLSEQYFAELATSMTSQLQGAEMTCANWLGEQSDFVRFNAHRVRQAGTVGQYHLNVRLINGKRHASATMTVSGNAGQDVLRIRQSIETLRGIVAECAEDPYLLVNDAPYRSRHVRATGLPDAVEMVDAIMSLGGNADLVGFLARGPIQRGFANSAGQFNWHEVETFNFEWSLYSRADKAVKCSYSDFSWDAQELGRRMERAHEQLGIVARPAMTIAPGHYRAYLSPQALASVAHVVCWDGFSAKARATRQSALQRLEENEASLSPLVSILENTQDGLAPAFQADGFARPPCVPLICEGRNRGALVSPRTALEYGLIHNGADATGEAPHSLDMLPGTLKSADVLAELGTGLYINNLWYLNFSDRMNCRITGMTRFATFWVENGNIVGPCNVMRFDDSAYRMLGSNLVNLTAEREWIADSATYTERQTDSMRMPGALLDSFALTL
jgi:predicted Zn-dependent protease